MNWQQPLVDTMEYYSAKKGKEILIQHESTLKTLRLVKEARQRGDILNNFIYMKYPELENL